MENMLTAYDVVRAGVQGQNDAMQAAAHGDILQQNRLALKVQQMQLAEAEKQTGVKNFLASNWREMVQPPTTPPAGPAPQPDPQQQQVPNNLVAGPGAPSGPPPQTVQGGVGAGVAMPTGDPLLTTPPQQPAAAPPRPQFPSDDELMAAVQSGKIKPEVADGVRAERVQFEQAALKERINTKLNAVHKMTEKFMDAGDDEKFQAFTKQLQADPEIAPYLPKFDSISVPRKGELETVMKYDKTQMAALASKYPELGITPETPEGSYKLTVKNNRPTKWEPVKDVTEATKTPEQLRKVFADPKLPREDRDKAFNDFKLSSLSTNQLTAIATDKTLPIEYQQFAKGVLAEEDKRAKNRTEVKIHMNDGDDKDSFHSYTKEMKLNAFKDRNLGTYRYPSGMKSMSEKKAFDAEYYKWRANGKITAADVAGERSDAKALTDLVKREQLIGTFTNRIEANTKVVEEAFKTLNNKDSRLLNKPINSLTGVLGSGQLQSVKLALRSLSNEIAKVESGSLGIAEVSKDQAEYMHKVHDENLSLKDMKIIMEMGTKLGKTSKQALEKQRTELKQRLDGGDKQPDVMDAKPPAAQHKNQILYGHGADAGKRWKSDGKQWVPVH